MEKIIQIIPAVTDLYAVWKEDNDGGEEYGVNKAYYLGLSESGEVFPLVIMGDGYIDTSLCCDLMMFNWNDYQWWKLHEADLPVNEYYNRFEREQREKSINMANEFFQKASKSL